MFNPSPEARVEGAEIKALVEASWTAPDYYYHLKPGGHVAALRQHTKHSHFFKADIADFFGSISRSRVSRSLKEYVSHTEARRLATASTVRHPDDAKKSIVPYGFVQSPLLASMVLHKSGLGSFLDSLHRDGSLTVTVYVDDIIVSSDDPEKLEALSKELEFRVTKSGFSLNLGKSQGPAMAITVFNIELAAGKALAIAEDRLVEFNDLLAASKSDHQVAGLLGYVRSVNSEQADAIEPV